MSETLALVIAGGALVAAGTVLLLTRPLTRIVLGAVLLGNGVNLLLLASSGPAGQAPLSYPGIRRSAMADPLPQAFVLTAIVITLALTGFLATMAYRAWQLSGSDDVQDDVEDVRVARRAEHLEERERLRAAYRTRRRRYLHLADATPPPEGAEGSEEAAQATETAAAERAPETAPAREAARARAYRRLGRARDRYREARRRARSEVRADRARQARAEETGEEDDPWETILGADR